MKKYRLAAVLMILHSLMEIGGVFALFPILSADALDFSRSFSFVVPYLRDHLALTLIAGGLYGAVRLTGAVGLLLGRVWGLVLSVGNCFVTMALMLLLLPYGVADGVLAGAALILMLTRYYGKRKLWNAG